MVEEATESQYVPLGSKCDLCGRKLGFFATGFWSCNTRHLYDGALYSGCGNDKWAAYLADMDWHPIVYSFTLLDHDTLLMKLYWETDEGAPMVAYKSFYRVSEYDYE